MHPSRKAAAFTAMRPSPHQRTRGNPTPVDFLVTMLLGILLLPLSMAAADLSQGKTERQIGLEISVPRHLADGEEFRLPIEKLLAHGKLLFDANWTDQEGGGRPATKGTGRPLGAPSHPLVGARAFNRISGPDANACTGCHNAPYGISGGGGDFVTNVLVLAQRFDFVSFDRKDAVPTNGSADEDLAPVTLQDVGNSRRTTGMFGAGYLEMLARQMT